MALERHGLDIERQAEAAVVDLAYKLDLPLVATNEPFFPRSDDYEAHDALLSIAEGRLLSSDDRRRLTPEHHFASRAEMIARFNDVPEALENTVEIARRCHTRPHVVAADPAALRRRPPPMRRPPSVKRRRSFAGRRRRGSRAASPRTGRRRASKKRTTASV